MFNFGKTHHDSVSTALRNAFDNTTKENAVDAKPADSKYHLQYAINEPEGNVINLTGIESKQDGRQLLPGLPLDEAEVGEVYLLLESQATTAAEAHAELEAVAETLAGTTTFDDPRSFQTIDEDEVEQLFADIIDRVLFWR
jgi:hypothetical protein